MCVPCTQPKIICYDTALITFKCDTDVLAELDQHCSINRSVSECSLHFCTSSLLKAKGLGSTKWIRNEIQTWISSAYLQASIRLPVRVVILIHKKTWADTKWKSHGKCWNNMAATKESLQKLLAGIEGNKQLISVYMSGYIDWREWMLGGTGVKDDMSNLLTRLTAKVS